MYDSLQEYKSVYKEFVKDYIKIFDNFEWNLEQEMFMEPVLICQRLLEYGAEYHYYDTTNRLLALLLHGVIIGLQVQQEADATAIPSAPPSKTASNHKKLTTV